MFYNAYILPHLDYCCTIWGNANTELINLVVKFQKRVARSILGKPLETPSAEMFSELHWMTFPDRVDYQKAILMHKITHNLTPSYLSDLFQFTSEIHSRTLRSTSEISCMFQNLKLKSTEILCLTLDLKFGIPFLKTSKFQVHLKNLSVNTWSGQPFRLKTQKFVSLAYCMQYYDKHVHVYCF